MSKVKKGEPPIEVWDGIFADPEVGRVLRYEGVIANANKSSIEELATIKSLNPEGRYDTGYFCENEYITQFPELKYCTGLTYKGLYYAFSDCTNLTTVGDIPEGVTNLYGTFDGCESLTTAPIIPSSVTNLTSTFKNCYSIDGIYIINAVNPPTYKDSFKYATVKAIYVPDASVDAYKSASGWSDHRSKIYPMSSKP